MVLKPKPRRYTIFPSDEVRAKKDDEFRPMPAWNTRHRPSWISKRILAILGGGLLIWTFVHYIPTDMGPANRRMPYSPNSPNPPPKPQRAVPVAERRIIWDEVEHDYADKMHPRGDPSVHPQQVAHSSNEDANREYDGAVKFYHLASTLRLVQADMPFGESSTNVLFAASDLQAVAALIPMACEMGNWRRNSVHIAIMGKSEISQEEISAMSGVGSCDEVAWHDARPDNAGKSSDRRIEISVAGGLGHIVQFIQPVAVITVDMDSEHIAFALGMQRKIKELRLTHIQVPKKNPLLLGWLARLDSAALKAWHYANFDILVQAPLDSSGGIIRLLKSLSAADYSGFNPPRLIIELPHVVSHAVQTYLNTFMWPPPRYFTPGQNDQLTIRRRITEQRFDPAQASLRFIESFYPTKPDSPHVLLLSPQVELSPVYFHYLKLHLLEFRHSSYLTQATKDLFGISLESPSTYLNGSLFKFPQSLQPVNLHAHSADHVGQAFRWQAPNHNAALYFADKWMEVHSFIMHRNTATISSATKDHFKRVRKEVSTNSPAWMEYFFEYMRIRGSTLYYPAPISFVSGALAITHNELYQMPEEFAEEPKAAHPKVDLSDDVVLAVKEDYLESHHPSDSRTARALNMEGPLRRSIDDLLLRAPTPEPAPETTKRRRPERTETERGEDEDGEEDMEEEPPEPREPGPPAFTPFANLTLLDFEGREVDDEKIGEEAHWFRFQYRQFAGGCSETAAMWRENDVEDLNAEDLFCRDQEAPPVDSNHEPEVDHAPHQETHSPHPESPHPDTHRASNSDGAAAHIDRVENAADYEAAAAASLKEKLESKAGSMNVIPDDLYPFAQPKSEHLAIDEIAEETSRRHAALEAKRAPGPAHDHERDPEVAPVLPKAGREKIGYPFARPKSSHIDADELAAEISHKEAALKRKGALPDHDHDFEKPAANMRVTGEADEDAESRARFPRINPEHPALAHSPPHEPETGPMEGKDADAITAANEARRAADQARHARYEETHAPPNADGLESDEDEEEAENEHAGEEMTVEKLQEIARDKARVSRLKREKMWKEYWEKEDAKKKKEADEKAAKEKKEGKTSETDKGSDKDKGTAKGAEKESVNRHDKEHDAKTEKETKTETKVDKEKESQREV